MNRIINQWLALDQNNVVHLAQKRQFYADFLQGQNKDQALSENTRRVRDALGGTHNDLDVLEGAILAGPDISRSWLFTSLR